MMLACTFEALLLGDAVTSEANAEDASSCCVRWRSRPDVDVVRAIAGGACVVPAAWIPGSREARLGSEGPEACTGCGGSELCCAAAYVASVDGKELAVLLSWLSRDGCGGAMGAGVSPSWPSSKGCRPADPLRRAPAAREGSAEHAMASYAVVLCGVPIRQASSVQAYCVTALPLHARVAERPMHLGALH